MADYKTQSNDTDPKIERFLIKAYQQMTSNQKAEKIAQLSQACSDLAIAGICDRYPEADEREIRLRLGALRLDRQTMIKAFGWDPHKEGY